MTQTKSQIYSRLAAVGESDSGKSVLANMMARCLADSKDIRILDTEFRGNLYRTKYPVGEIITLDLPFELSKAKDVIDACKKNGTKVLIIDSATPFWERVVEVSDEMKTTVKDGRRIWAKLTPQWDAFKMAINAAPFHIITTWRVKDVVSMVQGEAPQKKVITRGGGKALKFDYHVVFSLNEKRQATVIKDNYDLFSDWKEPRLFVPDDGKKIAQWLKDN